MAKMKITLFWLCTLAIARAQTSGVDPQIRNCITAEGKVTMVELMPHFVTTIQLPESVNSVVVGDPDIFLVEHNEHEPNLVFAKPLTLVAAETNLLITTTRGRHISLLLTSRGIPPTGASAEKMSVDFLLHYGPAGNFVIEPEAVPYPLVPQTAAVGKTAQATQATGGLRSANLVSAAISTTTPTAVTTATKDPSPAQQNGTGLDELLDRQKQAKLPELYGQKVEGETGSGDRLRTGISEVLDEGQDVVVLFSVVNTSKHPILLMPLQVQLGGKDKSGKLIKHEKWSTAEQLAIIDFRLSQRRIWPKERADGVVVFTRPPYKQSNETLFLQMAESGAVDRPALAPIGFGVSRLREEENHGSR
ncbi:MAG TPA: hypothetical protein VGQ12_17695 [Candidatus Angelobacter sp.]|jgi:hypothetical protein|nr:hypothetical protein [Candidatus Angelobacter sp.]